MIQCHRIALLDRVDSHRTPGGDTVQIHQIAEFLERNNFKATIVRELSPRLKQFDLAILFNLTRPFELYVQAQSVLEAGIPYLLFPVYWDLDEVIVPHLSIGFKGVLRSILPSNAIDLLRSIQFIKSNRYLLKQRNIKFTGLLSKSNIIESILIHSAVICPNSNAEKDHLCKKFKLEVKKHHFEVIRNGIPERMSIATPPKEFLFLKNIKYVCCVGGIGPRKNQLNLVKAANMANIPLVLVGSPSKGSEGYYRKVRDEAGEHVYFTGHLSKEQVWWIMQHSIGHIQPSYIETPGLASLEAATLGCNIVVSEVEPVKEYFGKFAIYCNPNSVDSINMAITQLIQSKGNPKLQKFVKDNYNWTKVLFPLTDVINNLLSNERLDSGNQ
jgi:glycosyltransferase involved in cell wall biosynthesis